MLLSQKELLFFQGKLYFSSKSSSLCSVSEKFLVSFWVHASIKMRSITVSNATTLLFIKRKKKAGQYVKNTGHWECSQMQLLLNPTETTQCVPTEVLLFFL